MLTPSGSRIGIAIESRCGRGLKVDQIITIAANDNKYTRNTVPWAGDTMKPLKVKKPTPAIGVRIRRPIFSRHVRFSGLRRPKACQGEMTDNNGTVIHHIDA